MKQYRLPHSLREEVDKQISELLEKGIIRPSKSPYNTSLWVVPKKPGQDGKPRWRVVLDFRPLNEKTIPMAYPLPNITDIFDQVSNACYFTVIDCVSGFHQIALDDADTHKTAFSTPSGHFEFIRMPFGLRNAAAEYQRAMNITLDGMIGRGVFVYIDDIVIYAKTLEEHERLFDEVMNRLRKTNWKLEPKRCELLRQEVTYLGHIISAKGLNPDPKKVEAVKDFPRLKNVKSVRQFLGLAGYYRRFIKDFARMAKPLTKLLQKNEAFHWSEDAESAFNKLKESLCTAPLLQPPDMSKPFLITTDASGYAIGGILSQGKIGSDLPVAYTSRVLRGPELKYDVYEKEALAVIHAVRTFRPYVFGRKFNIITDHQPLIWFKTAYLNIRVQKWRFKLSEYDYEIIYKPGRINANADALSRNPVDCKQINVITRRQALMNKRKEAKEIAKGNEELIENKSAAKKTQSPRPKRNPSKKVRYVESDTTSDFEAVPSQFVKASKPKENSIISTKDKTAREQTDPTNLGNADINTEN